MKTNLVFPLRSISAVMVLLSSPEKAKRVRVNSRVTRWSPGDFPLVYPEQVLQVAFRKSRGISVDSVYLLFPLDAYIIILCREFEAFSAKT